MKGINVGVPSQRGSGLCAGATCRLATRMISADAPAVVFQVELVIVLAQIEQRLRDGSLSHKDFIYLA